MKLYIKELFSMLMSHDGQKNVYFFAKVQKKSHNLFVLCNKKSKKHTHLTK